MQTLHKTGSSWIAHDELRCLYAYTARNINRQWALFCSRQSYDKYNVNNVVILLLLFHTIYYKIILNTLIFDVVLPRVMYRCLQSFFRHREDGASVPKHVVIKNVYRVCNAVRCICWWMWKIVSAIEFEESVTRIIQYKNMLLLLHSSVRTRLRLIWQHIIMISRLQTQYLKI